MMNLLKNNFQSLLRNWVYWGAYIIVFMIHILYWLQGDFFFYRDPHADEMAPVTTLMVQMLVFVFLVSVLTPFIAGTEFDGGVIRNKIMAGFSRVKIYLASLVTCVIANLGLVIFNYILMFVFFSMGQGTKNVLTVLGYSNVFRSFMSVSLVFVLLVLGVSSLSCAVTFTIGKKAIAVVLCLIIPYIGIIDPLAISLYAEDSPEYYTFRDYDTGVMTTYENPFYLAKESPLKKIAIAADIMNVYSTGGNYDGGRVYETFLIYDGKEVSDMDISPIEYSNIIKGEYKTRMEVYPRYLYGAAAFTVLTTAAGMFIFKKRNLK